MCGIAGIMAYAASAPAPSRDELIAIRDRMRARGPDGAGEWADAESRVRLGHRRLAILDLDARADQPMIAADGRRVIVFNGEIYNFPELRAELTQQGVVFRTQSDTEALLHLHARYGEAMLAKLRGMYAFALYEIDERRLFLARDPYGIKPLYYADQGGVLRFASSVKALLAGGGVDPALSAAGLAGFCLFGCVPEPFTLHAAIRALPAGSTLTVEASGAVRRGQGPSVADVLAGARDADPAQAPQILAEAVRDSVRAHLLADVDVGVFLSAGVDSGALLGLARDAAPTAPLKAITLGFEEFVGAHWDEAPLAAKIAAHYQAEHTVRRVARAEFEADLPALLDAMDQPSVDGINTWFVSKAAREAGLKVALSGLGGDELFAGYSSFREIPKWVRRVSVLPAAASMGAIARVAGAAIMPGFARANPKALSLFEYGGTYAGAYLLKRGLFLPHELPALIGAEQARDGLQALAPLALIEAAMTPDPMAPLKRVSALESGFYMRNQLLRDADWAGMAQSVEIRTPLVDFTLLQSVAPIIAALAGGAGKRALAAAPRGALPDEIVNRAKTGFAVPTRAWTTAPSATAGAVLNERTTSRAWARRVLSAAGVDLAPGPRREAA